MHRHLQPPFSSLRLVVLLLDRQPCAWQDAFSEVISLHSRKRKSSKAGLGGTPAVLLHWRMAAMGGCPRRPAPGCIPLNWGPGRARLLCLQPPLLCFGGVFFILKAIEQLNPVWSTSCGRQGRPSLWVP